MLTNVNIYIGCYINIIMDKQNKVVNEEKMGKIVNIEGLKNWTFGCSDCTCEWRWNELNIIEKDEYVIMQCPECNGEEINIFYNK